MAPMSHQSETTTVQRIGKPRPFPLGGTVQTWQCMACERQWSGNHYPTQCAYCKRPVRKEA